MNEQHDGISARHRAVLDRFVAACHEDARVVVAFLGGSNARGEADAHSDLDLCAITTDGAFDGFRADRETFLRRLGEPIFIEDFGLPDVVFCILADGTECELHLAHEGGLRALHAGQYRALIDKKGVLQGVTFAAERVDSGEQREVLRGLIAGFWHELSHFITAMGRGQLWWAYGQLDSLRGHCVSLARLRHNFSAWAGGDEPYFKVEKELPGEELAPLLATCVARERRAMLDAARMIIGMYRQLAQALAQAHGLEYPAQLERVMLDRFTEVAP